MAGLLLCSEAPVFARLIVRLRAVEIVVDQHKVISDRSERASTIVTTNLPFSRWTELFENSTMVSALVDRLTYRSHVLDMSGPSYRLLTAQADAANNSLGASPQTPGI